ncbi:MAG: hypothetical protein K2Q22_17575, partial [Cytophagales bacterium]|nr:hypothetical protein [Cytophagales bacterium]
MLLFAGCLNNSDAQVVDGNDNSPYTQIGIGDLSPSCFGRNLGMANTGVSMSSKYYISLINPALLADNRLTIIEFGLQARLRLINSNDGSQRNFGGNFNYVAISFPITPKLSIAAGFKPFSTIRYSSSSVQHIQG